jgi:hypothetical protein
MSHGTERSLQASCANGGTAHSVGLVDGYLSAFATGCLLLYVDGLNPSGLTARWQST